MRKFLRIFIVVSLLAAFFSPVSAKQTEWKDPAYNFGKTKTVVVMDAKFTYDGFDVSGDNKFEKYPYAEEKIKIMLNNSLSKITNVRFISLSEVTEKIKERVDFPGYNPDSKEFSSFMKSVMPQYADAVLFVEIRDFGWFYEYYGPYESTETQIVREEYGGVTPDGKKYSGWREVPVIVTVHHDAGYKILDSAEANWGLVDAATWKYVWKYSDSRTRGSFAWGKPYNYSGPESMMKRIMNVFSSKTPFASE